MIVALEQRTGNPLLRIIKKDWKWILIGVPYGNNAVPEPLIDVPVSLRKQMDIRDTSYLRL